MNLDRLVVTSILSVIQSHFRGVAPRSKEALVKYLYDKGFSLTASCVEAIPESTYKQAISLLSRIKISKEGE